MPKAWVHPQLDSQVDQERFISTDTEDPRRQGGPCHLAHKVVRDGEYYLEDFGKRTPHFQHKYSGNPFGRWLDCGICGIRMGYWPKHQAAATARKNWPPGMLERALELCLDHHPNWEGVNHKVMKSFMTMAEMEFKMRGPLQRTHPSTRTSASTASSSTPAPSTPSPPAPMRSTPKSAPRPTSRPQETFPPAANPRWYARAGTTYEDYNGSDSEMEMRKQEEIRDKIITKWARMTWKTLTRIVRLNTESETTENEADEMEFL